MVEVLKLIDDVLDQKQFFKREPDFEPIRRDYNFKQIRALLIEGFSETELYQLCTDEPDFRPVRSELAQVSGLADIADKVLQYTKRRVLMDALLDWARATNLAKYDQLKPYF